MKYNVGDRVKIRKDLIVGKRYGGLTYICSMEIEIKENDIVTISETGVDLDGIIWYEFEELRFSYSEAMIEGLVEASTENENFKEELQTDNKFAAFLREVACERNDSYYEYNEMLDKLINPNDYFSVDEDELIEELVEFYTNFEPMKKKLTMAELREIVGEDFEIVEE